jgi:hypothetical protein
MELRRGDRVYPVGETLVVAIGCIPCYARR